MQLYSERTSSSYRAGLDKLVDSRTQRDTHLKFLTPQTAEQQNLAENSQKQPKSPDFEPKSNSKTAKYA